MFKTLILAAAAGIIAATTLVPVAGAESSDSYGYGNCKNRTHWNATLKRCVR